MNINILRYFLFGIAGGQEVDRIFIKFIIYPLTMIALMKSSCIFCNRSVIILKHELIIFENISQIMSLPKITSIY